MYKKALKMKLRVNCSIGVLTVEQMFDLSLNQLAVLNKELYFKLKSDSEDELDYLDESVSVKDEALSLAYEIAKDIFIDKKNDRERERDLASVKQKRQYLLSLRKEKEMEEDKKLSIEDIDKELKELDNQ